MIAKYILRVCMFYNVNNITYCCYKRFINSEYVYSFFSIVDRGLEYSWINVYIYIRPLSYLRYVSTYSEVNALKYNILLHIFVDSKGSTVTINIRKKSFYISLIDSLFSQWISTHKQCCIAGCSLPPYFICHISCRTTMLIKCRTQWFLGSELISEAISRAIVIRGNIYT